VGRFSASNQVGCFILAVRALRLAAGPMGAFDASGVEKKFIGDGRRRSPLVVNIGCPGGDAWRNRLPRLEHEDVIDWV
jgi:3-hydroxypropanoate dehydrogenase